MFRKLKARTAGSTRRGPRRLIVLALLSVVLGGGFLAAGIVNAPPAQAFMGICDPDESFPAPATPGGTLAGIEYTRATLTPTAPGSAAYAVVAPIADQASPVAQYGGSGLHWYPFGLTCTNIAANTWSMISNFVFEILALWPARMLGVLMSFAFSTAIGDWVLSLAGPIVNSLSQNVFLAWGPLLIMCILLGAIIKMARGKAQQGWSQLAWLVSVITVVTGVLTGPGLALMTSLNDYTRDITTCVTFATTGAGCASNNTSGPASYANGMVESLAQGTWAIGAIGDMANRVPSTYDLTVTTRDSNPTIADNSVVRVPTEAIPAKVAGQPTWAEIIRWTQTYTSAESAAMVADAKLRCSANASGSPSTFDLTNAAGGHPDKYNGAQLCSYKWLVRAALASTLAETAPQEYTQFRGISPELFTTSLAAVGLLPLAFGIGAMGFQVLLLQIELAMLFIAGPFVGLAALMSPKPAGKWAEMVTATLVRRVAIGLTLGLILWISATINTKFVNVVSGPYDVPIFPPQMIPLATSLLTIGVMIAGFKLLSKLSSLMLAGIEVPEHTPGLAAQGSNAVKQGGKKIVQVGVAAAAGALSGGTSFAAAGALRGVTRSGAIGGTLGRAARAGDRAGDVVRRKGAKGTADATANVTRTVPAATAAERGVTDAWRDLLADPKVREAAELQLKAAEELQQLAERELETARGSLASQEALARIQERAAAEGYTLAGMDPVAAQARAAAETATARQPFADAVVTGELRVTQATEAVEQAAAGAPSPLAVEIAQSISRGESADQVATRIGADDELLATLRNYEDALHTRRRVRAIDRPSEHEE